MFDEVQPVIGPYDELPAACQDPDPRAAEIARQVAGLIARHLPSLRAEHVGSTSVPGCGGRGIIDLLIACPERDVEYVDLLLGRLGFRQGGEVLFPPHPPAYRGAFVHNGDAFLLNVHVLPAGAAEVDSIRFFRSCLRADAELARAYVQHKRAIISSGTTEEAEYCRQKAAFLKMVLG
ncbi:MAG: GrpB family protein [Thermoguttaceae bacterium]